ncbi:hypothetical protein E2562_012297 [Oryza meyeriana var. granulata]|uniref:DUF834 domain-containing protein n=1 Tax=Oryza meyeriana var. granulata TaxID=110450 RepID=A0A6G1DGT2_9ORYZ|nr:hypothetical protein E2562_012297 [Oryza meyeriana var. granulata]
MAMMERRRGLEGDEIEAGAGGVSDKGGRSGAAGTGGGGDGLPSTGEGRCGRDTVSGGKEEGRG